MTDLTKVKIWKVLAASNHFWVATLVLYFQSRGLSLSQALQVMSIYSILIVVLEYPTGVIGDFFSHRTSILLGNVIGTIAFGLLTLPGTFSFYVFIFFLFAVAISLTSGSDSALLHSVSKDFKKDLAQTTPYALILSTINIAVGGLVATLDLRYPLYLSFLTTIPTLFLIFSLKDYKYVRESGNIFATAFGGIKDILSNSRLKSLMVVSSAFGAFFVSIKWFYNPLFEGLNIPVSFWGLITGAGFLLIALGAYIYRKKDSLNLVAICVLSLAAVLLMGITSYWLIPVVGIWLVHILGGYRDTWLGVEMNDAITTGRRASILSFNNLLIRLGSAAYIAVAGLLITKTSFTNVFVITVLVIGVLILLPLMKLSKK